MCELKFRSHFQSGDISQLGSRFISLLGKVRNSSPICICFQNKMHSVSPSASYKHRYRITNSQLGSLHNPILETPWPGSGCSDHQILVCKLWRTVNRSLVKSWLLRSCIRFAFGTEISIISQVGNRFSNGNIFHIKSSSSCKLFPKMAETLYWEHKPDC